MIRPTDQIIAALRALAQLLEEEPYLSDIEREAICRAVFKAVLSKTKRRRAVPEEEKMSGIYCPEIPDVKCAPDEGLYWQGANIYTCHELQEKRNDRN